MDFKCFMKLLVEKEYIKRINSFEYNSEMVIIEYKCKYNEVKDRIIAELDKWHSKGKLRNIQYEASKNNIKIINESRVRQYLLDTFEDQEKFYVKTQNHFNHIELDLKGLFKFDPTFDIFCGSLGNFSITNMCIKRNRLAKEKREKKECLDFLSKLP